MPPPSSHSGSLRSDPKLKNLQPPPEVPIHSLRALCNLTWKNAAFWEMEYCARAPHGGCDLIPAGWHTSTLEWGCTHRRVLCEPSSPSFACCHTWREPRQGTAAFGADHRCSVVIFTDPAAFWAAGLLEWMILPHCEPASEGKD